MQDENVDIINETKLLGTILTHDLKWSKNTSYLVKKAYARMQIIRKLYSFVMPIHELITIYEIYIRSVVEQSAVVWHSSLIQDQATDLERVK